MKKDKMLIIVIVAIIVLGVVCLCMTVFSNKGNEAIKYEPKPSTDGEPTVVGGYSLEGAVAGTLPENAKTAFDEATANLTGVSYKPLCCLGTQVVAGTNYAILATSKAVVPNAQEKLVVLFIYDALNENAKITSVEDFDLLSYVGSDVTTQTVLPNDNLAGGWNTPQDGGMNAMPQRLASASSYLYTLESIRFTPLACVATQVVAGTNYALVCSGIGDDNEFERAYTYMVVLYDGVDGTREILSVMPIYVPDLRTNA